MVTGDYHYTATSVARKAGMVPADGKVVIIQAQSEFQSLHADSGLSESQHEAYPEIHSPSGGQSERGAGGRAWAPIPLPPPQQPPGHVGARNSAHVQSAREVQTMHVQHQQSAQPLRKTKSELELSTTAGSQHAQQTMGHPSLPPQHGTQGVITHTHGWSTQHQAGNDQGLAQGSASMQGHGLLESPGDHRGLAQASASPQSHDQGDEEASGHHQRQGPPQEASEGQWAWPVSGSQLMRPAHGSNGPFSTNRHATRQQQLPDALSPPGDAHIGHSQFSAGPCQSPQSLTGHAPSPAGHPQSSTGHPQLPAGLPQSQAWHPQQLCHGLRVTLEGRETACHGEDALQELTSVAQGRAQCCVTGPAFAHMLGQADRSVLDMVLQNVVVFARMQSQQKGQVMELLGARGLHLVLDGQQHHIQVAT